MNKSNVHFVKLAVAVREACDDMYTIISDKARTEKDNETLRKEIEELRLTLASLHEREDEALAIVDEANAACEASRLQQEELEQANTKLLVSINDMNSAMQLASIRHSQTLTDVTNHAYVLEAQYMVQRNSLLDLAQCLMDTLDLCEQDYLEMVQSKDVEILRLERRVQFLTMMRPSPLAVDLAHIVNDTGQQEPVSGVSGLGVISHVFQRCTKKE